MIAARSATRSNSLDLPLVCIGDSLIEPDDLVVDLRGDAALVRWLFLKRAPRAPSPCDSVAAIASGRFGLR